LLATYRFIATKEAKLSAKPGYRIGRRRVGLL
jgi:hypothetical protein